MRPQITYDELITAVETYEKNQMDKIQKMKTDITELKDFLTIDDKIFTKEMLGRVGKMIKYIDDQSELYQEAKEKYDLAKQVQLFTKGVESILDNENINKEVTNELINNPNFTDVIASAIVGQFADQKGSSLETKFNKKEFDSLIQKGASAEVIQTIKRIVWAEKKHTDNINIEIRPVGSLGGAQDILLIITGKTPRGREIKLTLREDVKSSLKAHYLMSETLNSYKEDIRKLLQKSMSSAIRSKDKLYLKVDKDELYQLVAERLGKKYGLVYNNGAYRVNSAIFFTSPDGKIEMGSEMLKRKDFQIEMDNTITKMAIRLGYISSTVGNQDKK